MGDETPRAARLKLAKKIRQQLGPEGLAQAARVERVLARAGRARSTAASRESARAERDAKRRLPTGWREVRLYMPAGNYDQLVEFARAKGVSFSTYARRTLVSAPHGPILSGENPNGWENCP